MKIVNYIVSASNLSALIIMYYYKTHLTFLYYPMIASILYHLSETKHGLPGIYPFNKYTYELLMFDRVFAMLSFLLSIYKIYDRPSILTGELIILSVIAFMCLPYSERDVIYTNIYGKKSKIPVLFQVGKVQFMISHIIWHCLAYYLLFTIFNNSK